MTIAELYAYLEAQVGHAEHREFLPQLMARRVYARDVPGVLHEFESAFALEAQGATALVIGRTWMGGFTWGDTGRSRSGQAKAALLAPWQPDGAFSFSPEGVRLKLGGRILRRSPLFSTDERALQGRTVVGGHQVCQLRAWANGTRILLHSPKDASGWSEYRMVTNESLRKEWRDRLRGVAEHTKPIATLAINNLPHLASPNTARRILPGAPTGALLGAYSSVIDDSYRIVARFPAAIDRLVTATWLFNPGQEWAALPTNVQMEIAAYVAAHMGLHALETADALSLGTTYLTTGNDTPEDRVFA